MKLKLLEILDGKAADSAVVHISSDETITGDKEFTGGMVVSSIVISGQTGEVVTEEYVDSAVATKVSLTGSETISGTKTFTSTIKTSGEFGSIGTVTQTGNNYTLDLSTGVIFSITALDSLSIDFSNSLSNSTNSFQLIITNGGDYTCSFVKSIYWDSGEAPELTSGGTDILSFMTSDGGTTWYGILTASNVATA